MEVAIRTSTIIASLPTAICGAKLVFFDHENMVAPFIPTNVEEVSVGELYVIVHELARQITILNDVSASEMTSLHLVFCLNLIFGLQHNVILPIVRNQYISDIK
jgi:hypothetical protein